MLRRFNPDGVAPPLSNYSHGVVVPEGMKQLHVSGQVGMAPDGTMPGDVVDQAQLCFSNVLAILAAEGMTADNLVSMTTYVVGEENLDAVRKARAEALGDVAPASTLVFVEALASPAIKVEIQAIAASTTRIDESEDDESPTAVVTVTPPDNRPWVYPSDETTA